MSPHRTEDYVMKIVLAIAMLSSQTEATIHHYLVGEEVVLSHAGDLSDGCKYVMSRREGQLSCCYGGPRYYHYYYHAGYIYQHTACCTAFHPC